MINLTIDELKLVAKNKNIKDYENKSKKDLIKVLSKPKPKIGINKKKLEEIRKYFNELRHKFSKKLIDKYRKAFYDIKNYRYLSTSEIEEARQNLTELEENMKLKKFHGNLIVLIRMILIIMIIIMILLMMMNTKKLEALEDYLRV